MSASDKIALIGIVINACLTVVGWYVSWLIARSAAQKKKTPVPQAGKKRRRQAIKERRYVRICRVVQLVFLVDLVYQPFYVPSSPPVRPSVAIVSLVFACLVSISDIVIIVYIQRGVIRRIKQHDLSVWNELISTLSGPAWKSK